MTIMGTCITSYIVVIYLQKKNTVLSTATVNNIVEVLSVYTEEDLSVSFRSKSSVWGIVCTSLSHTNSLENRALFGNIWRKNSYGVRDAYMERKAFVNGCMSKDESYDDSYLEIHISTSKQGMALPNSIVNCLNFSRKYDSHLIAGQKSEFNNGQQQPMQTNQSYPLLFGMKSPF